MNQMLSWMLGNSSKPKRQNSLFSGSIHSRGNE